jgi:thiol-disulfide isomerase/thioredoxin
VTGVSPGRPALAVTILIALIASSACGTHPQSRQADPPAPRADASDPYLDLTAEDPHGRALRFADFAGTVRVIDLWATWCGPCRETIPELNALYARYRDRGLVVIGISVDEDPAAVLEFQREVPMRYPTGLLNPAIAARVGNPEAIPTTLLIDRRGRLVRTFVGFVDVATLEAEVLKLF